MCLLILNRLKILQPFTSETADPLQKILANQTTKKKDQILKTVTEAARNMLTTMQEKSGSKMKLHLL